MTPLTFTLRDAVPADAPALVQLIHTAFREHLGVLVPPSGAHAETVETVGDKMARGGWILASSPTDEIVGCVLWEPQSEWVYLGRLGVLPAWRGIGIGGALIRAVEARARQLHFGRVRLGVRLVLAEQRAAYEALGYQAVEYHTHPGYTEPTYVTLEKTLAPFD